MKTWISHLTIGAALLLPVKVFAQVQLESDGDKKEISEAQFTEDGKLLMPDNVDQWVFLGASVGHGYPQEAAGGFSKESPGLLQVVQMEPAAYDYFIEYGEYADGTMMSLAFYRPQESPKPAIDGLVQGELASFEIHLIDKELFPDQRAFYLFATDSNTAAMLPEGNSCVRCHREHTLFDGTFAQFYPVIRQRLSQYSHSEHAALDAQ